MCNKLLKDLKLSKSFVIQLNDYLSLYCGLDQASFQAMTHKNLKTFNIKGIKCVSFPYALKHGHYFRTGDLIMVEDCRKKLAPYINPNSRSLEHVEITNYQDEIDCFEEEELEFKQKERRLVI